MRLLSLILTLTIIITSKAQNLSVIGDFNKATYYSCSTLLSAKKISIRQLLSLDQVNQVMTTNIYLSAYWLDPRLKWDPIDYSNLSAILIPFHGY